MATSNYSSIATILYTDNAYNETIGAVHEINLIWLLVISSIGFVVLVIVPVITTFLASRELFRCKRCKKLNSDKDTSFGTAESFDLVSPSKKKFTGKQSRSLQSKGNSRSPSSQKSSSSKSNQSSVASSPLSNSKKSGKSPSGGSSGSRVAGKTKPSQSANKPRSASSGSSSPRNAKNQQPRKK